MKLQTLRVKICLNRFRTVLIMSAFVLSIMAPLVYISITEAAQLGFRRLQLSDSTISSTDAVYNFSFNTLTSGPLGSISFEICSNYKYEPTDPCTQAPGSNASTALLSAQAGVTDFSLDPGSTATRLVITRPVATVVSPQPLGYTFSQITNPDNIGSYYVRIATYASTNASGPETDNGVVVFATNAGIGITTEVPPYLLFCTGVTIDGFNCGTASGSFLNFGELSATTTRTATSQLLASTNAPYGYSITLAGTTMTAGNNVIPAMPGGPSQVGVSQFGINGRLNSSPIVGNDPDGPGTTSVSGGYNIPNVFRFVSGDIIASSSTTDDYRKLTMSYIVNRSADQPPGRYVATISYICLANF